MRILRTKDVKSTEESERVSTVEADIARLHRRVAKHVMENMNKYYTDSEDFDPRLHKIRDIKEYSRTAKVGGLAQSNLSM